MAKTDKERQRECREGQKKSNIVEYKKKEKEFWEKRKVKEAEELKDTHKVLEKREYERKKKAKQRAAKKIILENKENQDQNCSNGNQTLELLSSTNYEEADRDTLNENVLQPDMHSTPKPERLKVKFNFKKPTHSDESHDVTLASDDSMYESKDKSRQAQKGVQIRKQNQKTKNQEIEHLKNENTNLKKEIKDKDKKILELEKKLASADADKLNLKEKSSQNDLWLKKVWSSLTKDGRNELKNAVDLEKHNLPYGTLRRLRDNTGINLSRLTSAIDDTKDKPELQKQVEEFVINRSQPIPDMKYNKAGKTPKRYTLQYKEVLHSEFLVENPDVDCHFSLFARYWPKHVIRPKGDAWGTCLCDVCENMSLKIRALKREKIIDETVHIDEIIRKASEGETEDETEFLNKMHSVTNSELGENIVTYCAWKRTDEKKI